MAALHAVPEKIEFSKEEENILKLWKDINAFQECLKQSKGKPRYTFFDGPPFATGLPHYGHILAGTIKDVVTRYAHQNGYHVERRFGWDCHGLPVEYEIDKTFGITGPADVAKMGIAAYNQNCKNIVGRYTKEWENIVTRMGRWIDFKNDYKTMYPWYMESIWWVFSELWFKGLVYKGVKVMPYSTACSTPLSNFESGQNYKEVNDPAVTVSFPLVNEPEVSLIAWTTTPWTLPSNLALCVNKSLQYVKIKMLEKGAIYILMEARLPFIFKNADEYVILEKFPGQKLAGLKYKPIFPYFSTLNAFVVLTDDYVSEDSGTGIVHQAPYFGEDDYRVCLAAGIITRDQEIICPLDASGCFTEPVTDFLGLYVKDADKNIIKHLKETKRLVNDSTIKHNYPFCWRSETPLIYKAVPSWFIRVEEMSDNLLKTNKNTYWVPDYVKEKRFGNWLRDARDWAVSRNRYWGTPIPLWSSKDGDEIVCISSIAELEKLSGVRVTDIHRESIDHIVIPSKDPSKEPLRRVTEVFDCWFESGSMPYAQLHYPFENLEEFNERFPADFVAEGIDQTRGWFYTLLVISTALFNKPPFKNLIANGLILASDGQKMSKRKKNYPDPLEVVHKYGADALRLYLVSSPVVRAENLRFKEDGVRDILKDIFLPWYNAYRFLVQNVLRMNQETGETFILSDNIKSDNIMDKWILSFTQSLLKLVENEMTAYRLYTVVPKLVLFIDNLTNWYVRMNRKRFKGETGLEDNKNAIATLSEVLLAMIQAMSPFTPFLCEHIFQNLRHLVNQKEDSIHYLMFPKPKTEMIDESIERAIKTMQTVIELGRVIRDRKTIPVKYPLSEVIVVYKKERLSEVEIVKEYIRQELNVRSVTLSSDRHKYGIALKAEPDHKVLGARLKSSYKEICPLIKELKDESIQEFIKTGEIELLGHKLQKQDIRIMFSFEGSSSKDLEKTYEVHSDNEVLVLLDIRQDSSMTEEGTAKEIINRIQKLRKKAHLVPTDVIKVFYFIKPVDSELNKVAETYKDFIETSIKAPFINKETEDDVIIRETFQIKGVELTVILTNASPSTIKQVNTSSNAVTAVPNNKHTPVCRYVNVILNGVEPSYGISGTSGIILLENPKGENFLTFENLQKEVSTLFGLYNRQVLLVSRGKELTPEINVQSLSGNTIYVEPIHARHLLKNDKKLPKAQVIPRFVNIEFGEKKACALLENPVGETFESSEDFISRRATEIFKCQNVKNFTRKNEYEVNVSCI